MVVQEVFGCMMNVVRLVSQGGPLQAHNGGEHIAGNGVLGTEVSCTYMVLKLLLLLRN